MFNRLKDNKLETRQYGYMGNGYMGMVWWYTVNGVMILCAGWDLNKHKQIDIENTEYIDL